MSPIEVRLPSNNIALNTHNNLRSQHFQGSTLRYSKKLEIDAQEYANHLADTGTFSHDPSNHVNKYGENLYAFSKNSQPNLSDIIKKWYDEKKFYNYDTQECKRGEICGHYTQIVWKTTKKLGCASAQYKKGQFQGGYVTVCKYYPYGNIIGRKPY